MARLRLVFAQLLFVGALVPMAFTAEPDLRDPSLSDDEVIKAIQDQWKDRTARVTSFEFDLEIEKTWWVDLREEEAAEPPRGNYSGDPFYEARPSRKPRRWQLRYYFQRGKVAVHERLLDPGEIDPDAMPVAETSVAFDGEQTTRFHADPLILRPVADVNISDTPTAHTYNYSHILPLVLWREPSQMFRLWRWKPKEIEVVDRHVDIEGTPCIRLAFKRRGDGAIPSVGWLDVDPARGAAPLRWQHFKGKRPLDSIQIEYDGSGPDALPSSWTYASFPAGRDEVGSTRYARVTTAKVNEDVANDHFRISLPAGTLVREKRGNVEREYYAEAPGENPEE